MGRFFGVLFFTSGGKLLKLVGVLYPSITLAAIVVTANHYLVDAIAGALLMALAFCTHQAIHKGMALSWLRLSPLQTFAKPTQKRRLTSSPLMGED